MLNNISAEESWKETKNALDHLCRTYAHEEYEQDKARRIRYLLVLGGFFLAVLVLLFSLGRPISIGVFLLFLLIAIISACFLFFIFYGLFDWLHKKEYEDAIHLRNLAFRISIAKWRHERRSFRSLARDLIHIDPTVAMELLDVINHDIGDYTEGNATYTPLQARRIIEDFNLRNCRIDGIELPQDYQDAVSSLCTLCNFLYDDNFP